MILKPLLWKIYAKCFFVSLLNSVIENGHINTLIMPVFLCNCYFGYLSAIGLCYMCLELSGTSKSPWANLDRRPLHL